MGCCLALLMVPLLLLATPQRATLRDGQHHAGAGQGRVRAHAALTRLSTSWTIPVAFADLVTAPAPNDVASAASNGTTTAIDTGTQSVENASFRQALPTTTTAPTTTTTAAPPPPPPAAKPVTTTTAAPAPAPKPVATPPPPQNSTTGYASWYSAPAGTCASPTLAFGTVVTVTDLSTGGSVRCTVDDREASNPGRVLDLASATFSQLASLSAGVIEVRLTW